MNNQDGRNFIALLTSRAVAVILMIAVCCGVMVGYANTTYTVNVFADGEVVPVKTSARTPDAIVEQSGFTAGENDKVDTSSFTVGSDIEDGNALIIYRAVPVTIYDDGEKLKSLQAAGTVADALEKAGVTLEGEDATNYDAETLLKKDMNIKITRAYTIELICDGIKQEVDYATGTVKDVLKRVGITLGEFDKVTPALTKTLHPGSTITVKRISYETRDVEKVIKYDTVTKTSGVLLEGTKRVARSGQDGKKTITYQDKIVDGEVVSTKKMSEVINVKPVSKVVVKGTGQKANISLTGSSYYSSYSSSSLTGNGPPTSYVQTFHGSSTAYTGGGITASGAAARRGLVAVNPKQIPYGSKLYIVADDGSVYGYCTAADTGGFAVKGSALVDLYMDTQSECIQWGRRDVTIYVISWGNGKVTS